MQIQDEENWHMTIFRNLLGIFSAHLIGFKQGVLQKVLKNSDVIGGDENLRKNHFKVPIQIYPSSSSS